MDVDKLAGAYHKSFGAYLPVTPIVPACPVTLSLRVVTLTTNYKHHLINAYTNPVYIKYLQQKYDWDNDDMYDMSQIA